MLGDLEQRWLFSEPENLSDHGANHMPRLEYRDADKSVLLHLTAPGMPELVIEDPGPDTATTLVK